MKFPFYFAMLLSSAQLITLRSLEGAARQDGHISSLAVKLGENEQGIDLLDQQYYEHGVDQKRQ